MLSKIALRLLKSKYIWYKEETSKIVNSVVISLNLNVETCKNLIFMNSLKKVLS